MELVYFVLFSIISGISEGFLYNVKDPDRKNKINEHIPLTIQRIIVAVALFGMNWIYYLSAACMFLYVHDLAYYLTRELLHKGTYPKWYWVTSETSTAWSDKVLNTTARLMLFLIGLILTDTLTGWILTGVFTLFGFGIGIRNTIKIRYSK